MPTHRMIAFWNALLQRTQRSSSAVTSTCSLSAASGEYRFNAWASSSRPFRNDDELDREVSLLRRPFVLQSLHLARRKNRLLGDALCADFGLPDLPRTDPIADCAAPRNAGTTPPTSGAAVITAAPPRSRKS